MKLRNLFVALLASAAVFSSCEMTEDLGAAAVTVTPETLTFTQEASSQTVTLNSTRSWHAVYNADWIAVEPAKGDASAEDQTVTITVLENTSVERSVSIVFNAGIVKTTLTVTQPGDGSNGNGTAESPYSVSAAVSLISSLSESDKMEKIYVQGKVSKLDEFGGSYGNYTYYISDTDSTGTQLEVYRGYGLNGDKFTSADELKIGDEVIVYGDAVNFKGNTPEFTCGSRLVYLNGKTAPVGGDDGDDVMGEAKGTGTAEDPFNVAAAITKAKEIGTTASTETYYVTGTVKGGNGIDVTYGNATFDITDGGETTATFKIYRCYSFNGAKFTANDVFKDGDVVVVSGKLVNYNGNTPEMTTGGQLISVNGKAGAEVVIGEAKGTGTAEDPFNVAAAIAKAVATDTTATADAYYITGTVVGTPDISGTYGNATFDITDGGETTATFNIFRTLSFNGEKFVGDEIIKAGDVVVICGKIVNYNSTTPETVQGATFISINGKTEFERKDTTPVSGDAAEFASNITWTNVSSAYDDGKATVNGVADVQVYKLGTSSKVGSATVAIPAGTKSISFYGVSWKAKAATLDIQVGGSSVYTQELATNDGATGNSPYTMTVTATDKYTYTFEAPLNEAVTATVTTTGTNTRVILFGIQTK